MWLMPGVTGRHTDDYLRCSMFCLLISAFTFVCGIGYLLAGYELAVGWVQIILGALCLTLTIRWLATRKKYKQGE